MKKDKDLLRKRIFSTTIADAARQSSQVMAQVEQLPQFEQAQVVAVYWPLRSEVDTRAFIERWRRSKCIVLPEMTGDRLQFRQYNGSLRNGAFRVQEPAGGAVVEVDRIDLAIVPGVAFMRNGVRLGRGKGYYDRFLASARAYKVGICFAEQILEAIPVEAHDIRMNTIIAPTIK